MHPASCTVISSIILIRTEYYPLRRSVPFDLDRTCVLPPFAELAQFQSLTPLNAFYHVKKSPLRALVGTRFADGRNIAADDMYEALVRTSRALSFFGYLTISVEQLTKHYHARRADPNPNLVSG